MNFLDFFCFSRTRVVNQNHLCDVTKDTSHLSHNRDKTTKQVFSCGTAVILTESKVVEAISASPSSRRLKLNISFVVGHKQRAMSGFFFLKRLLKICK